MSTCERFRRSLYRVTEGEASPLESLRVARHAPDCTACRILLAREERLHDMLDQLDDPVSLDEGFLSEVMAAIADRPKPVRRAARRWPVAVKLALLAGVVLAAGAVVSRFVPFGFTTAGSPSLVPSLDPEGSSGALGAAAGLVHLVLVALDRLGSTVPPSLAAASLPSVVSLAAVLPAALLALTLAGAIALAARI
jgi:predicted anti-sigma-YlaC factor YlaD